MYTQASSNHNLEAVLASVDTIQIIEQYSTNNISTSLIFRINSETEERLYPLAIYINLCQCNSIAALLDIPFNKVVDIEKAYLKGHALDWFVNSDIDLERAWLLSKEYFLDELDISYGELVKQLWDKSNEERVDVLDFER